MKMLKSVIHSLTRLLVGQRISDIFMARMYVGENIPQPECMFRQWNMVVYGKLMKFPSIYWSTS